MWNRRKVIAELAVRLRDATFSISSGLTIFAFLAAGAGSAQAAFVSTDDSVFGVGALTTDTATGLRWLDLTKSTDMSFNFVTSQFGLGGLFYRFRYANNSEISTLWTNAGIVPTEVSNGQAIPNPSNVQPIEALQALIGITIPSLNENTSQAISGSFEPTTPQYPHLLPYLISSGLTSSFCCGGQNLPSWGGDERSPYVGSWLVIGDPQSPPGNVPEPATLALVGAALFGVAATRRRRLTGSQPDLA